MNRCTGNCNQGRDCDCGPGSGMTIVAAALVIYGIVVGAALTIIVQYVWRAV